MKGMHLVFIASVAIFLLNISSALASFNIQQDDLGPVPDLKQIAYVAMSLDCHDIAMVSRLGTGVELRVDGKVLATADEIPVAMYSPDGRRLVYAIRKGNSWSVVIDGKEIPAGTQPPTQLVFSPDGKHLCFVTTAAAGKKVVLDGVEQAMYYVDIGNLVVDGRGGQVHVAYAARTDKDQWVTVMDGKAVGKTYEFVDRVCLSPIAQHIAFVGCLDPDPNHADRYEVVVEGKALGPYFSVTAPPTFSPSDHLMFGACRAAGPMQAHLSHMYFPLNFFAVTDGFENNAIVHLGVGAQICRIFYCLGDTHLALWTQGPYDPTGGGVHNKLVEEQPGTGDHLIMDGEDVQSLAGYVGANITLSPDGRQFALIQDLAQHSHPEQYAFRIDDRDGPGYFQAGPPLFSDDSSRCAYAAQRNSNPIGNRQGTDDSWFVVLQNAAKDDPVLESASGLLYPTVDADKDGFWHPDKYFGESGQTSIDNGHSYEGQIPYHFDPDGSLVYFRIADGHLYRVHWDSKQPLFQTATKR